MDLVEHSGLCPKHKLQALIHMQHEIAYMKQELEFIKKIILAETKEK